MATAIGKTHCIICSKEKATLKCGGCSQDFCYNHWDFHRQELNKKFDEIEVNRDFFKQSLNQHTEQLNNNILIEKINQWEENSIKLIQQTAEETKNILKRTTKEYIDQIEIKLNELTNQLRESRQENDFNETSLRQFQEELNKLTEELTVPLNISIREDSIPLINKISVEISRKYINIILFNENYKFIRKKCLKNPRIDVEI